MIISPGRQYIFVHIPKTGGTSLALALEARAMKDDMMLGDTPKAVKRRRRLKDVKTAGRLWKHSSLRDIDGLLSLDEIAKFFTFTLVRNPWDQLVSYYTWARAQRFDHISVSMARAMPFSQFVCDPRTEAIFTANPARAYMTRADGVEDCDLYIRLEHFAQDSAPLWDHLGFTLDLPKVNRSEREADYRTYYDTKSQEAVARFCASHIARFGYTFDG